MPFLAQNSLQLGSCIAGSEFEVSMEKAEMIGRQEGFTPKGFIGEQAY